MTKVQSVIISQAVLYASDFSPSSILVWTGHAIRRFGGSISPMLLFPDAELCGSLPDTFVGLGTSLSLSSHVIFYSCSTNFKDDGG